MRLIITILLAAVTLFGTALAADTPQANDQPLTGMEIFPLADLAMGMKATGYFAARKTFPAGSPFVEAIKSLGKVKCQGPFAYLGWAHK